MSNSPARLQIDGEAIVANWRALDRLSGPNVDCGAAVKADGYGLGARAVVAKLVEAGCRDFYVATWGEAEYVQDVIGAASLTVLNGVLESDMALARTLNAKPMLNTETQLAVWRETGRPCDIMIDTGMNRLGISARSVSRLDWSGLEVDVLASHLASADEDSTQNPDQLAEFHTIIDQVPHRRRSMANSAGIALGTDYAFDLTRPGLSIYGGVPRPELTDHIREVGKIETRILQTRDLKAGDKVGYNATFTAQAPMKIAIAAIGYADGYLRGFSDSGCYYSEGRALPVIGRVSMDLIAVELVLAPHLSEGDWIEMPLDLPVLATQSGLSQYEVLTTLGPRFDRVWSS